MFEPAATGSGESDLVTDRLAFAASAGEGRSSTPRPSTTTQTQRRPTDALIPRLLALGWWLVPGWPNRSEPRSRLLIHPEAGERNPRSPWQDLRSRRVHVAGGGGIPRPPLRGSGAWRTACTAARRACRPSRTARAPRSASPWRRPRPAGRPRRTSRTRSGATPARYRAGGGSPWSRAAGSTPHRALG